MRQGATYGYTRIVIVVIAFMWVSSCLNVLREYERAVIFRLGRLQKPDKGPGLIFILWPIDKLVRVSLRLMTWDMPPQDIITRDNVSLKVNAVVYFRVVSAQQAFVELENYRYAVEQLAQTTLRSVLGEVELDDLLSQREKLNSRAAIHSGRAYRALGHQGDQGGSAAGGFAAGNAARHRRPG